MLTTAAAAVVRLVEPAGIIGKDFEGHIYQEKEKGGLVPFKVIAVEKITTHVLDEKDRQRLDELLAIVNRAGRSISEPYLHGFFSGLIMTPTPVRPEKWLAVLFGEEDIPFPSETELRELYDIISDMHRQLGKRIADGADIFPYSDPGGQRQEVIPWCRGLFDALHIEPHWWHPDFEEEVPLMDNRLKKMKATILVFLLGIVDQELPPDVAVLFQGDRKDKALEQLPMLVRSLDAIAEHWYWQKMEQQQEENVGKNAARRTGRNDPCPCGSGRKYKKCCGSQR